MARHGELFYVDAQGQRQDAALHDDIMDGVDDVMCRAASAKFAMSLGVSLEDAMAGYGVTAADIAAVPPSLEYGGG